MITQMKARCLGSPVAGLASSATISHLQPDIYTRICRTLPDINDTKKARLINASWSEPAARAVRRLQAPDGNLPPGAWAAFPEAEGLMIQLSCSSASDEARLSQRLSKLAAALPARVTTITIRTPEKTDMSYTAAAWAVHTRCISAFATELSASRCASSITSLDVDHSITCEAAAQLLHSLANLQTCELAVQALTAASTISCFPATLRSLTITATSSLVSIDLAGLAACKHLQKLIITVRSSKLISISTIAAITTITCLDIAFPDLRPTKPDLAHTATQQVTEAASQLPQLQHLVLRCSALSVGSKQWAALQQCASLRSMCFGTLVLGSKDAAVLQHITHLHLHTISDGAQQQEPGPEQPPNQAVSGQDQDTLTRLMPSLQELHVSCSQVTALRVAELVRGHPSLQVLAVSTWLVQEDNVAVWPTCLLSSIPQLRVVKLRSAPSHPDTGLGQLLVDAAACAGLQELHVSTARVGVCRMWCWRELLTGACKDSLRVLVLLLECYTPHAWYESQEYEEEAGWAYDERAMCVGDWGVAMHGMAEQLFAGLPALQQLRLDDEKWGRGQDGKAQRARQEKGK